MGQVVLAALPGALVRGGRASKSAARLRPAAAALARLLGGQPTPVGSGPARGLLLRAEPRSVAWLTGKVEHDVQCTVADVLGPGDTFVDVGASVGFFTLLAARRVGPTGAVVAFEPSPVQAASLRANVALNGFCNVDVVEKGLSDQSGTAFLADPAEATAELRSSGGPGAVIVEVTTLDTFLRDRHDLRPTLVKIDVEGHEEAVLGGMEQTLRTARPFLIVESHGSSRFAALLEGAGYKVDLLRPGRRRAPAAAGTHVVASPAPCGRPDLLEEP